MSAVAEERVLPQSLGFFTALKLAMVVTLVTLMALGFIVQQTTNRGLNQRLMEQESELQALRNLIHIRQAQLADLRSPRVLRQKVAQFNLGLEDIKEHQIIRLYDEPKGSVTPGGDGPAGATDRPVESPVGHLKPLAQLRPLPQP